MKNESKTLFIPLYGKAKVSQEGIILKDMKAEEIWVKEGFELRGKARSKWLAYFMGMRSAAVDEWTEAKLQTCPQAIVLHIGCGLDSRILRVKAVHGEWFDVDLPEVIEVRRQYYEETVDYKMVSGNAEEPAEWLGNIPKSKQAIVIMEGISMYLMPEKLKGLLLALQEHFTQASLIMDVYTTFAIKASKYKNPINSVGAGVVNGIDEPKDLELNEGIRLVQQLSLTPEHLVNQLTGLEKAFFEILFAGKATDKLYCMYEYEII